jgi:hypothetical protein
MLKDGYAPEINMENHKEIMSRLKFIGKIRKGEKINVKFLIVQPNTFMTSISRAVICPDNKSNTKAFLQTTVAKSFEIIERSALSSKTYQTDMCKHLVNDLKAASEGILNLKQTYMNDIKFCCDIDTLLQDITAKLHGIEVDTDFVEDKQVDCTVPPQSHIKPDL